MPSHRSVASATAASGTSIVVNAPAGVTDGDTLYLAVAYRAAASAAITPPAGWSVAVTGSASGTTIRMVYKKTASSEPASYTVSFDQTIVCCCAATIACYDSSGVALTESDANHNSSGTGTTSTTGTAMDVLSSDSLLYHVVMLCSASTSTRTHTPPSGMTEQLDTGIAGTASWCGIMISSESYTSGGNTGARTGTLNTASGGMSVATISLDLPSSGTPLFFSNNF